MSVHRCGATLFSLWCVALPALAQAPSAPPGPAPAERAERREPVVDERAAAEDPCAAPGERSSDCPEPTPGEVSAAESLEDERAGEGPEPAVEPASLPETVPSEGLGASAPEAVTAEARAGQAPSPAAREHALEPALDPRAREEEDAPSSSAPRALAAQEREGLGFGGLPAVNYDADGGFGLGLVASVYWYEKGVRPYRYALTMIVFATTRLVQDHQIRFDAVNLFDLPLRLTLRGGYFQSVTQNFCGLGNAVTCDEGVASAAAASLGLTGEARTDFERRYYLQRVVRPYGQLLARWGLSTQPVKLELMLGYRGHLYVDGDPWADDDKDGAPDLAFAPYPGSLYDKTFPLGQSGYASVLSAGLMVDDRDQEASPTRGYWVEGSVRASSFLLGSAWNYLGANLTARTYVPLLRGARNVVLAQRLVLDATVGDLPVQEMVRVGGSWDYTAFGGGAMGRGIRLQRYIGRLKALDQVELRADLVEHELFDQRFRWGAVSFLDAGWVGADWTDLGEDPLRVNFGVGGGLRIAWNDDFVVRADVAVSPDERYAPSVYIDIGHTF